MKQKIRRLLKRIYKICFKPFFKNGVMINIGDVGRFRFDYIFAFSRYNSFGTRHNSGFRRWIELCKGQKTIFDIGAHIGLYSIPTSSVIDKGALIYAFEPSLTNRSYLEKHISFNNVNNVKVIPYIVGDESLNEVIFYENRDVDPMSSVMIRKNFDLYNKTTKRQVSLDDFCSASGVVPEIIKIDVEGSEMKVLKGAENILKKYKPILFLSIHPRILSLMGLPIESLTQFIDSLGYAIYNSDGSQTKDFKHNEYILIHKERDANEIF